MSGSFDIEKRVTRSELVEVFRSSEKPREEFRVGAESEKFGLERRTGKPLSYDGDFGVCRIFRYLAEHHGWKTYAEREGGPIIALTRGMASITLEPGMQLELSGAPHQDLFAIEKEFAEHFSELDPIGREMGLTWLLTGFHPFARGEQLPWVPKERYPLMRAYLPTKGSGALDMMQRTATVQANFDYESEADAMMKVRVALALSPLLQALFANSPFEEGAPSRYLSRRGEVWRNMDPSRSGLIPPLWKEEAGYEDYIEWSLDAGMFLFRRGDSFVKNTGQTFRDFLKNGFEGHYPTLSDFRAHLATLFPEVRLKSTIEVRSIDSLDPRLSLAMIAVFTGILYDSSSLEEALDMTRTFSLEGLEEARLRLLQEGPKAKFFGQTGFDYAERILTIAQAGLERRALLRQGGASEAKFLKPLMNLVERRITPAEVALARVKSGASILEATEYLGSAE